MTKVLVFGDIGADIKGAILKAHAIHKRNGPFDIFLILGVSATETELRQLDVEPELPTFIKRSDKLQEGQLSDNLAIVGSRISVDGVSIACYGPQETKFESVDLLLTDDFPEGITQGAENVSTEVGAQIAARQSVHARNVFIGAKPRYAFCSSPLFWERTPYKASETRLSRFISLGSYGTSAKWFYAFNLHPTDDMSKPAGACPFTATSWSQDRPPKRAPEQSAPSEDSGSRAPKRPVISTDSCFFCLSNPNLDRDLIVSIADESYLALAKGPLTDDETPCKHVLFIPLSHASKYSAIDKDSLDQLVLERHKYMVALRQMYAEAGLVPVAFEVNSARGVHIHVQIVPVPEDKLDRLEAEFLAEARLNRYKLEARPLRKDETNFFQVSWNDTSLVCRVVKGFDLQFGRRVLAKVLELPSRVDWRACVQTSEQEKDFSDKFKHAFQQYDFTS